MNWALKGRLVVPADHDLGACALLIYAHVTPDRAWPGKGSAATDETAPAHCLLHRSTSCKVLWLPWAVLHHHIVGRAAPSQGVFQRSL